MFGENKVTKQDLKDGRTLRLVKGSPFYTIQGEGPYAGHPAIFIRLHGCNLRCTFCDTQFDDPDDPLWLVSDLTYHIITQRKWRTDLIVITGGEPLLQNIIPLCQKLKDLSFRIQIETAGTVWLDDIEKYADIVVSPKTTKIHDKARLHASAFKYIISAGDEHSGFVPVAATQPNTKEKVLALAPLNTPVYLSPMDQYDPVINEANKKLVAELAMKHGVNAGLQMHKIFGLP